MIERGAAQDAGRSAEYDSEFIQSTVASLVESHTAYLEAIERVLGAPAKTLTRLDSNTARAWGSAVQKFRPA